MTEEQRQRKTQREKRREKHRELPYVEWISIIIPVTGVRKGCELPAVGDGK